MTDPRIAQLTDELRHLLETPGFRRRALPPANFWSIVHYGEQSYENRYNRVVRWLLDPSENHGFGAAVVNAVIAAVAEVGEPPVEVGTRRVRTRVETPVPAVEGDAAALRGRIDVTVVDHDNDIVLAVESKLSSSAHDEQLSRYRTHIDEVHAGWRRVYVFLTEADEEPDDAGWRAMTYREFGDILRHESGTRTLGPEVRHLIDDFLADIDRRSDSALDEGVARLYFDDADAARPTRIRHADLLVSVARDLEPDPAVFARSRIGRLGAYLSAAGAPATTAEEGAQVFDAILRRFEESAVTLSSSDLVRVLTYVLDHAPRVLTQDQAVRPGVADFFLDYFAHVTGTDRARPPRESVAVVSGLDAGGYLRTVRLNRSNKGLTFNDGEEGMLRFRVSGNDTAKFPWWVAHLDVKPGSCGLIKKRIAHRTLEEWNAPELHAEVVGALIATAQENGGRCLCGEPVMAAAPASD